MEEDQTGGGRPPTTTTTTMPLAARWKDGGMLGLSSLRGYIGSPERRPLRRSYIGKGCKLHPKSRMGGGREKRERGFFWRKLLLCSSAHNLFTRRRSPQKGNCGGGGKSHFEVRKLLPFKGWGEKEDKN